VTGGFSVRCMKEQSETTAASEWSIQQIARLASTTSRTLRHYDDIGLLSPSRIGANGYRYYAADALVRLQRILLLKDLGLSLAAIAEVLDGQRDDVGALTTHLRWLRQEQTRLVRQISSVETTILTIGEGAQPMAENMFDGFDHTQYKPEVEARWGAKSYADGDSWWRSKSPTEKAEWRSAQKRLGADWAAAAVAGIRPDSAEAQALARRHYDWLSGIPGTPQTADGHPTREYLVGLGEMYTADERFAVNYGGAVGAAFVRDALATFAELNL
jgi:MerR family transcriptional regulator, thiopeptide resistance regulator